VTALRQIGVHSAGRNLTCQLAVHGCHFKKMSVMRFFNPQDKTIFVKFTGGAIESR
jgi:hypothetical protein